MSATSHDLSEDEQIACRKVAECLQAGGRNLSLRHLKLQEFPPAIGLLGDLEVLDCSNTRVSDLEPLRALPNLTELDCSNTQVSDLQPLSALANLIELRCSDLANLRGVPPEVVQGECSAQLYGYFADLELTVRPVAS